MMKSGKVLAAAFLISAAASAASAAIIPSWRINPISPAAITASPSLANAISVSLMVGLTNGSMFNVAGLDLSPIIGSGVVEYYNQPTFGSDTTPNSALFPLFPDLEFDSYVGTTAGASQPPSVPGRLNGTGPAQVGTGGQFNVAWGATPNTGGTGGREIARITVLNGILASIELPISNGLVADSLNPNVNVALPPFPVILIPEPAALAIAGLGVFALRRR